MHLHRILLTLLISAVALEAAEYHGRVTSEGLPIPGATVTATQGDLKLVTWTGEAGEYVFENLAPGQWKFDVEMFGFAKAEQTANVGPERAALDWELSVGSAPTATPKTAQNKKGGFERVLLNRTAGDDVLSAMESAAMAAPVRSESLDQSANESFLVSGSMSRGLQMEEQQPMLFGGRGGFPGDKLGMLGGRGGSQGQAPPGFGRPPTGAAAGPSGRLQGMAGGMCGGDMRGGLSGGRGTAGGRPGSSRGQISKEDIQKRLEYLKKRGVSVFGNRRRRPQGSIRASASFSLNNSAQDARPYSLTGQAIDKASYATARFSGSVGGQLRIPKLLDSPHTFFFVNYSGTRSRKQFNSLSTLPSTAERLGDFSGSVGHGHVSIFDPATRAPFPQNVIPAARLDPAAEGLLSYFPLPNLEGKVQNYQIVTSVPNNTQNLGVRISQSLGRRDRLSFSVNLQNRDSETAQLYGFRDASDGRGLSANASWTRTLTPSLVNNLRVTFSRNRTAAIPFFAYGEDVAGQLGINGTSRGPENFGPPNLSFTNFGALRDGSAQLRRNQAAGLSEGVTWVLGSHNISVGFAYRRNQMNTRTDQDGRGSFSFSGLVTSAFDEEGNPLPGTGFDMADFLLGFPQTGSIRFGSSDMYFRAPSYNANAQDDWRMRSNLSINFGLRYEYSEPLYEKYGKMANLDIAPGFTGVAVVTPGEIGPYSGVFPKGLVNPDRNNLAPRIGIAWRPYPKRSMRVRAGYGVYFNGSIYNQLANRLAQQPPFANTATLSSSLGNVLTIRDGFAAAPSTEITNTYAVDRGYEAGYAQTWNLAMQQDLPGSLALEVGYLGTKGTRLDIQRLPNQAPPGSPLTAEERRKIGNAVGFIFDSAEGNSVYHAGQVRLMRRFRRGISFNALYTFSKSIDNVSTYGGGGNAVVVQNDQDLSAERGLSTFDQRHSLRTSFVLTSPVGEGPSTVAAPGWASRLLEDWMVSGSLTANSGTPFTAMVLGNRADAGGTGVVGSSRADATGLPVNAGSGLFNLAAFALPPPGRYGNAARNTIPGLGRWSMNLSLARSFPLGGERRRMTVRLEAKNALNHVGYTGVATTVNASNYGRVTRAAGMRTLTVNLRFRF